MAKFITFILVLFVNFATIPACNDPSEEVIEVIFVEGPPGQNGLDGEDGSTGPAGSQGPQGEPGKDGTDGANGAQGPQGIPGQDGEDGEGCTLVDNGDGTATMTCPDGTSLTWPIAPVVREPCEVVMFDDPVLEQCVLAMNDQNLNGSIDEVEAQAVTDVICRDVSDISGLECFPNASLIWLTEGLITDLTDLAHLHNLDTLLLNGHEIGNLEPLVGLSSLKSLSLIGSPVSDISPLKYLNLEALNLSGTDVVSLQELSGLSNLGWLAISETDVADLSPLTGLENLTALHAVDCIVNNPTPVASLSELRMLRFEGNPIDCQQYAGVIDQLRNTIEDNDLDNVCPQMETCDVQLGGCNSSADCADSEWGPYCVDSPSMRDGVYGIEGYVGLCQPCLQNPSSQGCGVGAYCAWGLDDMSSDQDGDFPQPDSVCWGSETTFRSVNYCKSL